MFFGPARRKGVDLFHSPQVCDYVTSAMTFGQSKNRIRTFDHKERLVLKQHQEVHVDLQFGRITIHWAQDRRIKKSKSRTVVNTEHNRTRPLLPSHLPHQGVKTQKPVVKAPHFTASFGAFQHTFFW